MARPEVLEGIREAEVDAEGCALDSDRDGVADSYRFTVTREEWAANLGSGDESGTLDTEG